MAILPAIITAEAAHVDNINSVFAAMGKGQGTVSVACVAAENVNATWQTTATHYIAQDMGAQDSDVAAWQAMCTGDLPQLPDGVQWGVNGIISSQDAQSALTGHMTVAAEAGLDTPEKVEAFLAGILAGKSLKFRPERGPMD